MSHRGHIICILRAAGKSISRVRRTMSRGRARGTGRTGRVASGRPPPTPPVDHSPRSARDKSRWGPPMAGPSLLQLDQRSVPQNDRPLPPPPSHSSAPRLTSDSAVPPPPPPPLPGHILMPPSDPPSPLLPAATAGAGNGPPGFTPDLPLTSSGPPGFPPASSEQQTPSLPEIDKVTPAGQSSDSRQQNAPATPTAQSPSSGLPLPLSTITGDLDPKDAAEEARLYSVDRAADTAVSQPSRGRAKAAEVSRRLMSQSPAKASSKKRFGTMDTSPPAQEGGRAAGNAEDGHSPTENTIFGSSAPLDTPTDSQKRPGNGLVGNSKAGAIPKSGEDGSREPAGEPEKALPDQAADGQGQFARAASREFSDSDDSLVLDELRPASPPIRGGNTWVGQAEEPLSTASSLSKSGTSSLPATAAQAGPPPTGTAAAAGALAGNGGAKASKSHSYSWKLGSNPGAAKKAAKQPQIAPTQSAAPPQNPAAAGKSYRWQLQNAGSKARQQAAASEQSKAGGAPKNLTWRRNAPPPGSQAIAQQSIAPQRPAQQAMQDAEVPPWLAQQNAPVQGSGQPQRTSAPQQSGAMTESERHVACAGQINPVWQAIKILSNFNILQCLSILATAEGENRIVTQKTYLCVAMVT